MKESSLDNGSVKRGFFGYSPELEPLVVTFQTAEYPDREPDSLLPYWRWLLVRSAERLQREPYVWLYLKKGSVVAHQGAIAIDAKILDTTQATGWFVETMAASAVRGSPIGPMLVKKAGEEIGLGLSLGQTAQMRQLQFSLGWKAVAKLNKWIVFCGPKATLGDKLPGPLSRIAGFTLYSLAKIRRAVSGARRRPSVRAIKVDRFESRHDELWQETAATLRCAAVRNSAYLNWKYLDRPGAEFSCYEFIADGRLTGIVITMLRPASVDRPYIRGYIVDMVLPGDNTTNCAVLDETVRLLRHQGAQTVTCQVLHSTVEQALAGCQFMQRDSSHHFLVLPGDADDTVVLEPNNWFLTLGDSDADAYPD